MGMRPETVLTWGGVSSATVGCRVEGYPQRNIAQRAVETIVIPGRSGSLAIDNDYYLNYTQQYTIYWVIQNGVDPTAKIMAWLHKSGYQKLVDSLHPNHYRMALFKGGFTVESVGDQMFRANVTFDCKPQWYRVDGDTTISIDIPTASTYTSLYITNPGNLPAYPLISIPVTRGESYRLLINNTLYITGQGNFYGTLKMTCDSDRRQLYSGSSILNNCITSGDFPYFKLGQNRIRLYSTVAGITATITPRWCDLL